MEKECEICGAWFTTTNPRRKYCDKCQNNPRRRRGEINTAMRRSKDRLGDDLIPTEVNCSYCKNKMIVPYKYSNHILHFCSSFCRKKYSELMASKSKKTANRNFICAHCGKEFESNYPKKFCSPECLEAARKEKSSKTLIGDIELTCKICKKKFTIHRDYYVSKNNLPTCCSKECRLIAQKAGKEARQYKLKKDREAKALDQKKKDYAENGLCIYCATPYSNCERILSHYRKLPEGAKYNKDGKVITCPKFKEKK